MDITEQITGALSSYQEQLDNLAIADSEHDKAKKLFDLKLSVLTQQAEGKSGAEKERNAKASENYKKLLDWYGSHYTKYVRAKATCRGAEAEYETQRSLLSYNKSLIEKGIL